VLRAVDPELNVTWFQRVGAVDATDQRVTGIATSGGQVVVGGDYTGSLTFASEALMGDSAAHGYVFGFAAP
jgi:hypothetical protein